jgi:hypothetical protein
LSHTPRRILHRIVLTIKELCEWILRCIIKRRIQSRIILFWIRRYLPFFPFNYWLCSKKCFHISFSCGMMIMYITTNSLYALFECYDLSFFKLASDLISNLFYLFITFMRFDLHQSLVDIPCHCILLGNKVVDKLTFFLFLLLYNFLHFSHFS